VLKRVCDDTHRPVREVNPEVPAWLSQIIDRLLAKDRADRYQTAEEVVDVLGTQLARRQRGNGESVESQPVPVRQTVDTVDEVGPAKGHHRRRRWLEIAGSLIVVLAVLFVIAEVTGVTRLTESVAQILGLRKTKALLVIHLSNPELRVLVNGNLRLTAVDTYNVFMQPSGCLVEVLKGDVRVNRKWFDLKPGMMVGLEVLNDAQLALVAVGGADHIKYDGPIHLPLTRSDQAETPGGSKDFLQAEQHRRLVVRIAQGIRSDPQAMSLLQQIKSTTEGLERAREVGLRQADPTVFALQEKRLEDLQQEYNEHVRTISGTIRQSMQSESVRDPEKHRTLLNQSKLRERIVEEFKRDPEVASLIEQIKSTREELDHIKGIARNGADPAMIAFQRRLTKLNEEYNELWRNKSDEIRQRLQREQSLQDAEYYDLWRSKHGENHQRLQREQSKPDIEMP